MEIRQDEEEITWRKGEKGGESEIKTDFMRRKCEKKEAGNPNKVSEA